MAKARFGKVNKVDPFKFKEGDIAKVQFVLGTRTAGCDRAGVVPVDDHGRALDSLSRQAIVYVVGRFLDPPDAMFLTSKVDRDKKGIELSSKTFVDDKTRTYLVQVIPSRNIQPPMLLGEKLGQFYLVTEDGLDRDQKTKGLEEMQMFNFEKQTVDGSRIKAYKDRVFQQEQEEKASSAVSTGDR